MHCLIIPDFKIELLKSILHLAIIEESFLAILVLVFLVNIDGKNYRAGCYLRWLESKESSVIELELGDLESHVYDGFVLVVVQNSQEPFHWLYWSWEVEVKSKLYQNLGLEIY